MTDQPDLSTLPQRMRYAATAIEEMCERNTQLTGLVSPAVLRRIAADWEARDREAAVRQALAESLARDLMAARGAHYDHATPNNKAQFILDADYLIQNGWTKP